MSDFDKIKNKISNLLDLSESSNENEAALAIEMANKLLKKYNLSMSEVSGEEASDIIEKEVIKCAWKWETMLCGSLAKYNLCDSFFVTRKYTGRGIVFVGTPENVEATIIMFKKIRKHFNHKARIQYTESFDRNSYLLGVATTIRSKLYALIKNRNRSEDVTETALVVIQDKAADYISDMNLKPAGRKQSTVNGQAYAAGQQAGHSAHLFKEIK